MGGQADDLDGRANELLEMIDEMNKRTAEIIAMTRKAREEDVKKFETELDGILWDTREKYFEFTKEWTWHFRRRVWWCLGAAVVGGIISGGTIAYLAYANFSGLAPFVYAIYRAVVPGQG
jgi:hypothetical protein